MPKRNRIGLAALLAVSSLSMLVVLQPRVQAQQTLGGITGTVTDKTAGVLPDTVVTIVGDQTSLTRTQKTNLNGSYDFVNLPIGTYTLTFAHDGFESEKIPSITVQADRTATVNVTLPVGVPPLPVTVATHVSLPPSAVHTTEVADGTVAVGTLSSAV